MDYLGLIAVEKFAEDLKLDFPILLSPQNFNDRIINIVYEQVNKRIDMAVERAKGRFDEQANREAEENAH